MLTQQALKKHIESISDGAEFRKFNFVSAEHFTVQIKSKVEQDKSTEFYNEYITTWMTRFSSFTAATWVVYRTYPRMKRLVYRKTYRCHRSDYKRKSAAGTARNQRCNAKVDFRLKFINRNTIKNDSDLEKGLNLTAYVNFVHSHKLRSPEAMKLLKSSVDTDYAFEKYFAAGLTRPAAKAYHELALADRYGDNLEYKTNANINPSVRHINYIYQKSQRHIQVKSFADLMAERKAALESDGGVFMYDNDETILIITPIMKKILLLSSLKTIVIDDASTSNGVNVTFLYVTHPTGSLPVASILRTKQPSYNQPLKDFKLVLEAATMGRCDPNYIIIKDCKEIREAVTSIFSNSKVLTSPWSLCQQFWEYVCTEQNTIDSEKRHILMNRFSKMLRSEDMMDVKKYFDLTFPELPTTPDGLQKFVTYVWERRCRWLPRFDRVNPYMIPAEISIRIMNEFIISKCKSLNIHAMTDVVCKIIDKQILQVLQANVMGQGIAAAYTKLLTNKAEIALLESSVKRESNQFKIATQGPQQAITFSTDTWYCDCAAGRRARFCDHLYSVVNIVEAEIMKIDELTDEQKCLFGDIVGNVKDDSFIKIEIDDEDDNDTDIKVSDAEEDEEEEDDDDDDLNENNSVKLQGDVCNKYDKMITVSPKSEPDDSFYLDQQLQQEEHLQSNDPLEERKEPHANNHVEGTQTFKYVKKEGELKRSYEKAIGDLNGEFRRLNKYLRENPSRSNLETMQRLTKELSKIRPVERADFSNIVITLNK